jgi:hypothetical protein
MRRVRPILAVALPLALLAGCSQDNAPPVVPSSTSSVSSEVVTTGPTPTPTVSASTARSSTKAAPTVRPTPTTHRSPAPVAAAVDPLTGRAPSKNPVLAVKVDNTFFEVPQFGVSDADIVFVEQVEGGLTRLICVFHSDLNVEVGPVRSVRTTDAELLPVFGKPGLVFSGGAGGPLADLAAASVVDTSGIGSGYFRSDAAYGTYNLHANLSTIASQASGLGAPRPIGFTFAATDPRVVKGATASSLQIVMESGVTNFSFTGGRYVRMRDGSAVSDYQGKVEAADNVLVQHVIDQPDGNYDSVGSPSYISHTVGSGAVTLYRDNHAIPGKWSRTSVGSPFTYLDNSGRALPFKPGKTWIVLAPQSAQVSAH